MAASAAQDHGLWKKSSLVIALLVALWIVRDDNFSVFTALKQHEPSERIFRSLLQINLILWGTALSLYIWSRTFDVAIIGELLFKPALTLDGRMTSLYHPVAATDGAASQDDDEDAHYDSDGEVNEPEKVQVPSSASVASAAFDMLIVILVALFLFTVTAAGYTVDKLQLFSEITAPIFALLLFFYLGFVAIVPWKKRFEFWIILCITTTAPWHEVTFRDGFIGDILTSSVRPLQDISFTVCYLLFGLRGWWSQDYHQSFLDQADASVPAMEKSWLVHTVVLPMCMISPLWWRFLQNLRQTFDFRKRWPYLGNALKYFAAAQVAMIGVFYPDKQRTPGWLASFVLATLYQVWWDIFKDWELFERRDGRWRLRERRMYPKTWFYIVMVFVNLVLRFCWTLTFLPTRYLNSAGVLTRTFGDLNFFLGPFIASAEIIRRTLWGLLRFELEASKRIPDKSPAVKNERDDVTKEVEMTPMALVSTEDNAMRPFRSWVASDMASMNDVQVLGELCLYATVFAILGAVFAAHRGTL